MKTLRELIVNNSSLLQGVAALVAIGSVITIIPLYIYNNIGSDITLQYHIQKSTLPQDLQDLLVSIQSEKYYLLETKKVDIALINSLLRDHLDKLLSGDNTSDKDEVNRTTATLDAIDDLERSIEFWNGLIIEKIFGYSSQMEFDRINIVLTNNTNVDVTGINIYLKNIYQTWNVEVNSDVMTSARLDKIKMDILGGRRDNIIVFPDVGALVPYGSVVFDIYGDFAFPELELSVAGRSSEIVEIIDVKNTGLVWFVHSFYFIPFLFFLSSLAIGILLPLLAARLGRRYANPRHTTANLLYNDACLKAVTGDGDNAMRSLREAVRHGYTKRAHMLKDEDLASLREREDFKQLLSEMSDEV